MTSPLERLRNLSPGWWAAAAGGAAAGAALAPKARILAGAVLGLGVLGVGLWTTKGACCDGCAKGQGCGGGDVHTMPAPAPSASKPNPSPETISSWDDLMVGSGVERAASAVPTIAIGEPNPSMPTRPRFGACA